MKKIKSILTILLVFLVSNAIYGQNEIAIWEEFVKELKGNKFTLEQIKPYQSLSKTTLMGFLNEMSSKANWEEWEKNPEIFHIDNQINFLIPLTFDKYTMTYNFTFITEGDKWYFRHLEAIFIRLDKISDLPTSTFPDVDKNIKEWMREEIYWSKQIYLFNFLTKEKGKDFAFSFFKDGMGYMMGAKTWVPFVPQPKAFILYLCWELANLRGNKVTLKELDDNHATVILESIYFKLYENTGHLKEQISFDDYKKIFETIWQDRAKQAGWNLKIEYNGNISVFSFNKD